MLYFRSKYVNLKSKYIAIFIKETLKSVCRLNVFQIFHYNYISPDRRFDAAIFPLLQLLLTMPNRE